MFKLIKNVEIYNPRYIGKNDILICGEKIVKIAPNIDFPCDCIINKSGFIAIPGIIDQHIHISGGGGEGGFSTRTKEVGLSDLIKGGITTVVGLLGTDSITQSVERLLAKAKALKMEGISAYCLTGSYHYPSLTITGSVMKDIAFIEEIIGVKLALSDHREPHITSTELKKLASDVRIASMLGNKVGIITLHMGDDKKGLEMILSILKETSIPIHHFRPTHVTRCEKLFSDSLKFLSLGGYIDITVGKNYDELMTHLTCIDTSLYSHVTFSSDGNGSFSKYDKYGNIEKYGVQSCDGILKTIQYLVRKGYNLEECLPFGTSNVSSALNLTFKGYIDIGKDADILLLDDEYELDSVIAKGQILMSNKEIIVYGTYE
ncbi:MAG TPA: beta-aspartyl-peptidase [Haloplasmataceae bacterium]